MDKLYNGGIRLYRLGVKMASHRSPKARTMLEGQSHTFEKIKEAFAGSGKRPIWIHAASLGEFEQGRPLIERIRREQPDRPILLSFFSPSGYEVRKNFPLADCVCYLPFDTPSNARAFIEAANPEMAVFVKYEFWGNFLEELREREIPTYLISAIFRPSQSFFKWWGGEFRKMLRCYTHIYLQDERSRELLASLGVSNCTVAGDTRFDRVTDILSAAVEIKEAEAMKSSSPSTMLIAGSSWPADEDIYIPWLNSRNDVKAIIAPHEFDEARIDALAKRIAGKVVRFSEADGNPGLAADAKVLIVDCFGKLASLYRYADIAYVGGGFGAGMHNINEAAVYGVPVLFGPNNRKFKEAFDMKECGGGFEITDAESCKNMLDKLTDDIGFRNRSGKAAGDYISKSIGATDKIYRAIFS